MGTPPPFCARTSVQGKAKAVFRSAHSRNRMSLCTAQYRESLAALTKPFFYNAYNLESLLKPLSNLKATIQL